MRIKTIKNLLRFCVLRGQPIGFSKAIPIKVNFKYKKLLPKVIKYDYAISYRNYSIPKSLKQAIAEWREQGRTDEQLYGVVNFFTGRGRKWLIEHYETAVNNPKYAIKRKRV